MKRIPLLALAAGLMILGCGEQRNFRLSESKNPSFYPNTAFILYADSTFASFKALNEKYNLDTVFGNEEHEFKKILLLRNWIHKTINHGTPSPGSPTTAQAILDESLKGAKFWCSYFMIVHNEVMHANGFLPRVINSSDGIPRHHGINEIWSNTYQKWFLSDAMYDIHMEKNGIPLSALEIRDEYFKNKATEVKLVQGPERIQVDSVHDTSDAFSKEEYARLFIWITWFKQNDIYTNFNNGKSYLLMYEDEYFKNNIWLRSDGKPHWAYNTEFLIRITDRNQLYWTPNTITSKVTILKDKARVELNAVTPLFKSYQMKKKEGPNWTDIPDTIDIALNEDKNEILFRVINLVGVTGPEHKIVIER